MGKASRWIRNFLLGKRDEKDNKKINTSILSVYVTTSSSLPPPAPKIKRRWSFGKSPAKGKAHKLSRSMDSAETTQLVMQAKTEFQLQRDRSLALLAIARDKHAAATKIQAAFRSYLVSITAHPVILVIAVSNTSIKINQFMSPRCKDPCAVLQKFDCIFVIPIIALNIYYHLIPKIAGKESIMRFKEFSQATSPRERFPCEEANYSHYTVHARVNVNSISSPCSKDPDGRGSASRGS